MDQINKINVYSTDFVKGILKARMDEFLYATLLVVGVLVATTVLRVGFWYYGLLFSILLYSLIGFGISSTSVYKINRFGAQIDHFSASVSQMNGAFVSAGGVEKFFYVLLALIWSIIFMASTLLGFGALDEGENTIIMIIEAIILLYIARRVIQNLCFVIFYSSVVLGSLKLEYTKYEKKLVSNYSEITDKLTRIKKEYIDEVDYLLSKGKSDSISLEKVKIYQGIIRDLDNILIEILKI